MGMTPDFLIEGITKQNVISIHIIDESGIISDSAEICLDNSIIPATGTKLQVSIGYIETGLSYMGLYTINEITINPQTIKIKAHAADLKNSFKSQKTDQWHQKTIEYIVNAIAAKHNYKPLVAQQFKNIIIQHIDQTAESDMHLLSRIAQTYGAISKPANGFLLFVPRGKAKSYTGQNMDTSTIDLKDVSTWQVTLAERNKQGSIIAYWHDINKGETIEERVGEEEPIHTLRGIYPNRETARAAAQSRQNKEQRLNMTLAGNPELVAESKIYISGFKYQAGWIITRAEHILDERGYRTIVYASADE